ncbi:hypothetical protein ACFV4N_18780 [Actinosynnema sp. NPDC059797]
MAEPIVPVRRDGTVDGWWRQVVETAGVEGLVNIDAGSDHATSVAESFNLSVTRLSDIDRGGPTRFTTHPSALPDEFDPTQARITACARGPLWQAVLAGDFTAEHEREHEGAIGFCRPSTADQVVRASLRGETFLDKTVNSFYENSARGLWPIPALVWVTTKDSYLDCLWFWNFRVLRSRQFCPSPMILVPADDLHNWVGFQRDLAHQLARPDEFAPDVCICSISVPDEALHRLAEEILGLHPTEEKVRTGRKWPNETRVPPFNYRVNLELRDLLLFERRYGEEREVETYATEGRAQLRFPSPIEFSGGGRTLLRLSSPLFDAFPQKDVLAKRIVNEAVWRNGCVQIATNAMNAYRLQVSVPSLEEATHALIEAKTAEWVLSEKGKIADALIDGADLSVLLRPSVYEAVTHLTTPRSSAYRRQMERMRAEGRPEDEIQAYGARWGGRGERRYDSAAGLIARIGRKASDPVWALESLCAMEWAERGFETNCGRCGLSSFVSLPTVASKATCPGCRASTTYAAGHDGVTLHYRLNTFIDLASDQGVLPHLLVIAALTAKNPQTNMLGGVLATFPDRNVNEIDVLGIHAQEFLAGEVKAKARDFTRQQLERDFAVSARLGVDTHLLAAVDNIPQEVEKMARELADTAGLRLLVLSKDELRPTAEVP